MKCLVAVCIVALVATFVSSESWQKPAFCRSYDCPEFQVIDSNEDFEVRQYKPAKWVSTSYTAASEDDMETGSADAFWRLFDYIDGANDKSMKMSMTTPVPTKLNLCTEERCEPTFQRSFYIPYEHQATAPNPTDSSVYVHEWPEMTIYVRSFGGAASLEDYVYHMQELEASIGDSSLYDRSQVYQVGYDGPTSYFNRHNEVWLVKKNVASTLDKKMAKAEGSKPQL